MYLIPTHCKNLMGNMKTTINFCYVTGHKTMASLSSSEGISVEHYGMWHTGCMEIELQPSRGVPCQGLLWRPTNSNVTLPTTEHLESEVIGCYQCLHLAPRKCSGISWHMINHSWHHPAFLAANISIPTQTEPTKAITNYTHAPNVINPSDFHEQLWNLWGAA